MGGEELIDANEERKSSGRKHMRVPDVLCDSTVQLVPMSPFCSLRVKNSFFGGTAPEKQVLDGPALPLQQGYTAHWKTAESKAYQETAFTKAGEERPIFFPLCYI